ncbi:hypothetical protein, partial [Bacillus sp. AFS040349]|uniref:hypothetical protein n=1 Tax=Bacillus sp. AFS040349 TaxID=2033502 RepID=UPI000BFDE513
MKIRQRNKNLLLAGSIGAVTVLIIASVTIYFLYTNWKQDEYKQMKVYEDKIASLETWKIQQATGYALNQDVEAGTEITVEMVDEVTLAKQAASDDILSLEDIEGRIAKVDLKNKAILTEAILFKEEVTPDDLRKSEYSFIQLTQNLKQEDFVDVRIQFPNGNDYILMSKKKVEEVAGETVKFNMDEEEILTMSSGIVDAYMQNAIIYALPYVDPYIQESSQVTYPPKDNVLQLILDSPNVVNIATEKLKARGRASLDSQLQALAQEDKNTYKTKVEEQQAAVKASQEEAEKTQQEVFAESTNEIKETRVVSKD